MTKTKKEEEEEEEEEEEWRINLGRIEWKLIQITYNPHVNIPSIIWLTYDYCDKMKNCFINQMSDWFDFTNLPPLLSPSVSFKTLSMNFNSTSRQIITDTLAFQLKLQIHFFIFSEYQYNFSVWIYKMRELK
jgi:hypothetical protein